MFFELYITVPNPEGPTHMISHILLSAASEDSMLAIIIIIEIKEII